MFAARGLEIEAPVLILLTVSRVGAAIMRLNGTRGTIFFERLNGK